LKIPARRRKGEAGQAALLIVLAIGIFLLGAVGLAVDASNLYAHRQMAQAAADAAAQAGLLSFRDGSYNVNMLATPYTCTASDTNTSCAYAAANGFKNAANPNDTVTVTYGDANSASKPAGVTLPAGVSPSWMTVTITRNVPTTLIRLVGAANSASITVSATAALTSPLPCFLTLSNSGTGLNFTGGNLTLQDCGMVVDSNMSVSGGTITVTPVPPGSIQYAGSYSPGGTVSPHPTPSSGLTDPFANISPPTYNSTCTYTNYSFSGSGSTTLSPGTYCGGIKISGGSVTFNPSTQPYVLLGGGFTLSGGTATGTGVTFYNTSDSSHSYGPVNLSGGTSDLSAPSSGSLAGMLFFQDRSTPAGHYTEQFTGGTQNITGILYFPESELDYTGGSTAALSIVAYTFKYTGGNATVSPPPQTYKLALVQ
jgi:Tfp pilus assembly protein PilX